MKLRVFGRYCDGQWFVVVGSQFGSGRTISEAFDNAMRGSVN